MSNVADFCRQITQMQERATAAPEAALKRLVRFAGDRLIDQSPVLTGQYRASHRCAVNEFDDSYYLPRPKENVDPILPADYGFPDAAIATAALGDVVNFSNSVPHAIFVEEGGGPTQPYAVYMVTAIAVENQAVREALAVEDEVRSVA